MTCVSSKSIEYSLCIASSVMADLKIVFCISLLCCLVLMKTPIHIMKEHKTVNRDNGGYKLPQLFGHLIKPKATSTPSSGSLRNHQASLNSNSNRSSDEGARGHRNCQRH